ncbi:MAG: hypothetical protein ABH827_06595 [bacterium]
MSIESKKELGTGIKEHKLEKGYAWELKKDDTRPSGKKWHWIKTSKPEESDWIKKEVTNNGVKKKQWVKKNWMLQEVEIKPGIKEMRWVEPKDDLETAFNILKAKFLSFATKLKK